MEGQLQQNKYKISIDQSGNTTILPQDNVKTDYTLIFIHGLSQRPSDFIKYFVDGPISNSTKRFKIILPSAPVRHVSFNNVDTYSWFDIRTYENSFTRPFEEAFSSSEVEESFQILSKIVERELKELNNQQERLFIGGFSQGCAMSLFIAYKMSNIKFGGVISVAGYFFEIAPYSSVREREIPFLIIHGTADKRRPLNQVQYSYERLQNKESIKIVDNMGHEMDNLSAKQLIDEFIAQRIYCQAKF